MFSSVSRRTEEAVSKMQIVFLQSGIKESEHAHKYTVFCVDGDFCVFVSCKS